MKEEEIEKEIMFITFSMHSVITAVDEEFLYIEAEAFIDDEEESVEQCIIKIDEQMWFENVLEPFLEYKRQYTEIGHKFCGVEFITINEFELTDESVESVLDTDEEEDIPITISLPIYQALNVELEMEHG